MADKHKWKGGPPKTGRAATCELCGVTMIHQQNHIKAFTLPDSDVKINQRPPCKPVLCPT